MTILEAIRQFVATKRVVHLQDIYAAMPESLEHSIRARVYENLGKHFVRVGKGLYAAAAGEATCLAATGDAWESIKGVPDESIDSLISDLPYPWLDRWVGKGSTRKRMQWEFEKKEVDLELGRELFRVLKEGAHVFLFVPADTKTTKPHIDAMCELLEDCGFQFHKRFIWNKMHIGMGYSGRASYEGILYLSRGKKKKPCDLTIPDVLSHRPVKPKARLHPCEKPIPLLQQLIRFATLPGEMLLDCFAGSCSTGKAALSLGRNSLMIDLAPVLE